MKQPPPLWARVAILFATLSLLGACTNPTSAGEQRGLFCTGAADCEEPFPHCETDRNTCVECLRSTDCAGALVCRGQMCVCESDEHCGEGQVCEGATCVEP